MSTLHPGDRLPDITLSTLDGGEVSLSDAGWRAIVVYRGAHCPICKKYLGGIEALKAKYAEAGVEIVAVTADSAERARPFIEETGFTSPVGFGLSIEQMKALGVYVSEPRSEKEAPAPFPEPALFVVNGEGVLQIVDKSNAPFARPDMEMILNGISFVQGNDYPIRGTLAA